VRLPGKTPLRWVTDPKVLKEELRYGFQIITDIEEISKANESGYRAQMIVPALSRKVEEVQKRGGFRLASKNQGESK